MLNKAEIIAEWSAKLRLKSCGAIRLLLQVRDEETSNISLWFINGFTCKTKGWETEKVECTISLSEKTLFALYKKEKNPQLAYLNHEITISGKLTVAMLFAASIFE